ncbi:MAG: hypothetical protein LUE99_07030 [Bacteroides sp.]|nr:hypothetical protein [Bacteroides sp.]
MKLAYEYHFPTGYNVAQDLLCESRVGMSFIAPCGIVPDESGECELTSDYVLQGTDASYVVLTLEVADTGGKVLSRMTGVQVPLKQGHLTLVRGKFLTTLMNAGIGIDPGYEGEFNIVIK